jgi:hypothetical protein
VHARPGFRRLASGFCSSARGFASRFFQCRPRGRAPCGSLGVPATWFPRGLSPPSHAHAGHTRRPPVSLRSTAPARRGPRSAVSAAPRKPAPGPPHARPPPPTLAAFHTVPQPRRRSTYTHWSGKKRRNYPGYVKPKPSTIHRTGAGPGGHVDDGDGDDAAREGRARRSPRRLRDRRPESPEPPHCRRSRLSASLPKDSLAADPGVTANQESGNFSPQLSTTVSGCHPVAISASFGRSYRMPGSDTTRHQRHWETANDTSQCGGCVGDSRRRPRRAARPEERSSPCRGPADRVAPGQP